MEGPVIDPEALAQRPQWSLEEVSAKRSAPAGTGVCVVKTVVLVTRVLAS